MPQTYTVKQIAEILGYSTNSIYTFLKEKRIEGVRVGKGRFRIPQTELDRLLQIKRGATDSAQIVQNPPSVLSGHIVGDGMVPQETHPIRLFGKTHLVLPDIFDWFVGAAAFVTGVALFLFNRTFESVTISGYIPIVTSVRIVLVVAGIGILLTSMLDQRNLLWHKVFLGALMILGCFMSFILWSFGQFDGMALYSGMSAIILLSFVIGVRGITAVNLYLTYISLAVAPIILFSSEGSYVGNVLTILGVSPVMAASISIGLSIFFVITLWWGALRKSQLYWATTWITGIVFVLAAFFYARQVFWSRAFFLIIVGFVSMFLPVWEELQNARSHRQQFLVHGLLLTNIFLLILSVIVVYVMQLNMFTQTRIEMVNKVSYGKALVEQSIEGATHTLVAASQNTEFIEAFAEKDIARLNSLSQILYQSGANLRRIVLLDADGTGVLLYPFGTFDLQSYAFRDYFQQAKITGQPYLSDIFEAATDQTPRRVVAIGVPVYNTSKTFIGVIAGSIDLESINYKLQTITNADRQEYFTVVDSKGKRIIHPDSSLIGQDVSANDPIRLGALGNRSVEDGYLVTGLQGIVAYDIIDVLSWGIAVKSPLTTIVMLASWTNIVVFGILAGLVIITAFFLLLIHARTLRALRVGRNVPDTS